MYGAEGYAKWRGVWYYVGLAVAETESINLSSPDLVSSSEGSSSIYVQFSIVPNADYYEIAFYRGGNLVHFGGPNPSTSAYDLQPDTNYTITCRACTYSGYYSQYTTIVLRTDRPIDILPTPTLVNSVSYPNIIYVTFSAVGAYEDNIGYLIEFSNGKMEAVDQHQLSNVPFHNLDEDTLYLVRCRASADHALSSWSNWYSVRTAVSVGKTKLSTPIIDSCSSTSNSITVTYKSVPDATHYKIVYDQEDGVPTASLSRTRTITGLDADETYYVSCQAIGTDCYDSDWSEWESIKTKSTVSGRPNNWQWTQTELHAFAQTQGYSVSDVSYLRWNAFLDRVEEFRDYHNSIHHEGVPSVLQYKMAASDRVMTATRFNGVRFAIGSMEPTGLTNVSPGDPVNGFYFPLLSNRLNSIE